MSKFSFCYGGFPQFQKVSHVILRARPMLYSRPSGCYPSTQGQQIIAIRWDQNGLRIGQSMCTVCMIGIYWHSDQRDAERGWPGYTDVDTGHQCSRRWTHHHPSSHHSYCQQNQRNHSKRNSHLLKNKVHVSHAILSNLIQSYWPTFQLFNPLILYFHQKDLVPYP